MVKELDNDKKVQLATEIYSQVCNSIRTTDEVSFKLLGLVPLVSAAGIFGISFKPEIASSLLVAVISFFAVAVTSALLIWELRNLRNCRWFLHYAMVLEEYVFYDALGKLPQVPREKFFYDALGKLPQVPMDKEELAIGQFRFRPDTEVKTKRRAEIVIYCATIFAWIVIGTYAVISVIFPEVMPTQ